MNPPVNHRRIARAQFLAAASAIIFTLWTLGLFLLVMVTGPVARVERIGYACTTGAAAVALWAVAWCIYRARRP